MKNALIIGDSGGIGGALSDVLQERGLTVTGLSRSRDGLDVTDEASVEAALGALEGPYDLIFVATGALVIDGAEPEKAIRHITPKALTDQFTLNAAGPMLVLKHATRLLPRREPAVFAALSARVGSIGDNNLGGWYAYRAAKAALNQMLHGAAVELGRSHRHLCVACLHPGTVETRFTADYADRHPTKPPAQAAMQLADVLGRLTPEHTGRFYDYAMKEIPW